MYKRVCIAFAFTLSLFLLSNVTAGSNGDAPQEGQDWIITQDTHVWDSEVDVKDIFLSIGKTLKLENVSLSIYGEVDLHGETTWINSTIYHEQDEVLDNISIITTDTPSGIISSNFFAVSLLNQKIVKPSPNRSVK